MARAQEVLRRDNVFTAAEVNFQQLAARGNGLGQNRNYTMYLPDGERVGGTD